MASQNEDMKYPYEVREARKRILWASFLWYKPKGAQNTTMGVKEAGRL